MKVIVLGAGAHMAKPAVKHLAEREEIKEIVLTDVNLQRVEELASELGPKATTQAVDVNHRTELVHTLKGADLVMNFIGPYYRFGTKALEAVIDEGINYIDICDDYDTTMEALELTERAKEKGVTALIGMGASPGVTNVLARLAADELDVVKEIDTYWVVGEAEPGGFGALVHMFHCMEGKIPTFKDGKLQNIHPFQRETSRTIDFGDPVGKVTLYHVGHPEPVTLSKFIPNVQTVTNFGAVIPQYQNLMFKTLVDFGLTSEEPISFRNEKVAPLEFLLALLEHKQESNRGKAQRKHRSVGASRIDVIGEKDGKEAAYTFTKSGYDTMADSTSIPAGVAALLMLKGQITTKGVIPPECVEPKKILHPLKNTTFFGDAKDFKVNRKIGSEMVESSLFDTQIFPEFA